MPFASTTESVVAVPISKIIIGFGYSAEAATASTTRSLPSCAGLSIKIFSPVLIPEPTTNDSMPQILTIASFMVTVKAGTTEEIILPFKSLISTWFKINMFLIKEAYSSLVLKRSEDNRAVK